MTETANRIMIVGPKDEGTYVVEFRPSSGDTLATSVPKLRAIRARRAQFSPATPIAHRSPERPRCCIARLARPLGVTLLHARTGFALQPLARLRTIAHTPTAAIRRLAARLQDGPRRHCVKTEGLDLSLRPLSRLAQDEEPERARQ
jgi:hypothetical protein